MNATQVLAKEIKRELEKIDDYAGVGLTKINRDSLDLVDDDTLELYGPKKLLGAVFMDIGEGSYNILILDTRPKLTISYFPDFVDDNIMKIVRSVARRLGAPIRFEMAGETGIAGR